MNKGIKKKIIIILAVIFALIFVRMISANISKSNSAKSRKGMGTPSVTVDTVKTAQVRREFDAPARVVAKYRVAVLARIDGFLTKSYFKEGDYVKAGQVLFEIEPQEYSYAAGKAKANLDNAKAQQVYYDKQLERYKGTQSLPSSSGDWLWYCFSPLYTGWQCMLRWL